MKRSKDDSDTKTKIKLEQSISRKQTVWGWNPSLGNEQLKSVGSGKICGSDTKKMRKTEEGSQEKFQGK